MTISRAIRRAVPSVRTPRMLAGISQYRSARADLLKPQRQDRDVGWKRDAQITGARSLWQIDVLRRLTRVRPQYGHCCMLLFWRLEF